MAEIIKALSWPLVILIVAIMFRRDLRELLARVIKVGAGGLEMNSPPLVPPAGEKIGGITVEDRRLNAATIQADNSPRSVDATKGIDSFLRGFDNPLVNQNEQQILKELRDRGIDAPADRERALVRSLAATQITLHFERSASVIWQSQLACLRYLNTRQPGAPKAELLSFYGNAKAGYPKMYATYSFDQWLGFLANSGFLQEQNGILSITMGGQEFLKYRLDTRKLDPTIG